MLYSKVSVEAFGYALPDEPLTSLQIEAELAPLYKKLGIDFGKLEALTGIKERRVWPVGTKPSYLASLAAEKALKQSSVPKEKIDLIIHAGVCRDWLEPSTANVAHHLLGLSPHCLAFDISNACLGFLNAMVTAANMIELGQIKTALIVSGENAGPLYKDTIQNLLESPSEDLYRRCLANLTLGSGSVAYVLTEKSMSPHGYSLLGGVGQTYSAGHNICKGFGNPDHLMMETNTVELMKHGLILGQITWELFCRELKWSTADHLLTHQISMVHHYKFFDLLKLDVNKGYPHCDMLGNTGSVAAPLCLVLASEANRIKRGETVALLGIGSGLNTMMLGLQC